VPSTPTPERLALGRDLERLREARAMIAREGDALEEAREAHAVALEARDFLQRMAAAVETLAHHQVARVMSRCLSTVFDDPYELHIDFDRKRGKTEAVFYYTRHGRRINPHTASGGVRQVAALAGRLADLALSTPPARQLLVLDEPFLGVSDANMPKMGALVLALSRELGVQFVIATHSRSLRVGDVVEVQGDPGPV
jgi:DNA repair exonuclease SbcCD ATPase subunit